VTEAVRRVGNLLAFLRANRVQRVLQAGGGDPETTLLLSREEFEVTVLEPSRSALARLERALAAEGHPAELLQATLEDMPTSAHRFDFVLAFNTLSETDRTGLEHSLRALFSHVREDGLFYMTLLSTRHSDYGKGREIEPATFSWNGSVRHYTDAAEIVRLLRHVEIIDLRDEEQGGHGSFHWHILGRNRDLSPPSSEESD